MRARAFRTAASLLSALALGFICLGARPSPAAAVVVTIDPDTFPTPSTFWDRWNYPFNFTPGTRSAGSTFGAFPDPPSDPPEFDVKDAQVLVVFDTATAGIPTGVDPSFYIVSSVRVTATHSSGVFAFDDTYDAWQTYLDPSDPDYVADSDTGRPIELYGIGLRNGYTDLSLGALVVGTPDFEENESYGATNEGQAIRNAYPLGFDIPDPEGDVSNNVLHPTLARRLRSQPLRDRPGGRRRRRRERGPGHTGRLDGGDFQLRSRPERPEDPALRPGRPCRGKARLLDRLDARRRATAGADSIRTSTRADSFDPFAVSPTIEIDYVEAVAVPTLPRAAHGLLGLLVFWLGVAASPGGRSWLALEAFDDLAKERVSQPAHDVSRPMLGRVFSGKGTIKT